MNNIDDPVGDVNDFLDLIAVKRRGNCRQCDRCSFRHGLVGIVGDFDRSAHFAPYLYGYLDCFLDQEACVERWPVGFGHKRFVAQHFPQLFRQMGHHWTDQPRDCFKPFVQDVSVGLRFQSGQGIYQFVYTGDGTVEVESLQSSVTPAIAA